MVLTVNFCTEDILYYLQSYQLMYNRDTKYSQIVKINNAIYFATFYSHMTRSTVKFCQNVMCDVLSL